MNDNEIKVEEELEEENNNLPKQKNSKIWGIVLVTLMLLIVGCVIVIMVLNSLI